jgi:hypothetical protein
MAAVTAVVTQTYVGKLANGNRIYNIKAVATVAATADVITITVTRLREIIGTPFIPIVTDATVGGAPPRYITATAVAENAITVTINAEAANTGDLTFAGQVVGR